MKIVVLTGSPRKNGNSAFLADRFIDGAREAGHDVFRFDCAFKKVGGCLACNHCGMDGSCVQKDDFDILRPHLIDADAVVFASPMYYFGLSSQLKRVIDRFYAVNGQIKGKRKKAVLLLTYADSSIKDAEPILAHFSALLNYLNWENSGMVMASGVWTTGSVQNTEYPEMAFRLGKGL